jgi:hypothetical protein
MSIKQQNCINKSDIFSLILKVTIKCVVVVVVVVVVRLVFVKNSKNKKVQEAIKISILLFSFF